MIVYLILIGLAVATVFYAVSTVRANARLRETQRTRDELYRNCFLRGLAGILAKLATADGAASRVETDVAMKLFNDMGLSDEDRLACQDAYRVARDGDLPASYYASLFVPYSTRASRVIVYEVLWDVAAADGRFAAGEDETLHSLLGWLALDDEVYKENLKRRATKFTEVDETLKKGAQRLATLG